MAEYALEWRCVRAAARGFSPEAACVMPRQKRRRCLESGFALEDGAAFFVAARHAVRKRIPCGDFFRKWFRQQKRKHFCRKRKKAKKSVPNLLAIVFDGRRMGLCCFQPGILKKRGHHEAVTDRHEPAPILNTADPAAQESMLVINIMKKFALRCALLCLLLTVF